MSLKRISRLFFVFAAVLASVLRNTASSFLQPPTLYGDALHRRRRRQQHAWLLFAEETKRTSSQRSREQGRAKTGEPSRNRLSNNGRVERTNTQRERSGVDPRRFNREITQCETALELLNKLQSSKALVKMGGGGLLNSVNFSTSLHRLGRFGSYDSEVRANILVDPRFALLLASLGEALAQDNSGKGGVSSTSRSVKISFSSRELSNIAWALAKLKFAPPSNVMPPTDEEENVTVVASLCQTIRQQLVEYASMRQQQQSQSSVATAQPLQQPWLPSLSRLAGRIVDLIAHRVILYHERESKSRASEFQLQEYANLLWSWATVNRVNDAVFRCVIDQLIAKQKLLLVEDNSDDTVDMSQQKNALRPQEWSNSIWAAASAQVYSCELLEFVAELYKQYPTFVHQFKAQELSNTAWGVATMLSSIGTTTPADSELMNCESAALEIIREIASETCQRAGTFKTQELANTLWAMATVGFGLSPSSESSMNNYIVLRSDTPDQDEELMQTTTNAILQAVVPIISKCRSQELNNVAWSLARLMKPDEARQSPLVQQVLRGIGEELSRPRRATTSQDIGTTLWSLATIEFGEKDVYRWIVKRLTPEQARRSKPQELSNTLWALATAEIEVQDIDAFDTTLVPATAHRSVQDPVTATFGMVAEELMRRPQDFKAQETKDILYSFSKAGIRHPELFQQTAINLVGGDDNDYNQPRGLVGFSPQGLGNMAWAFARQAQLACEVPQRYPGTANRLQCNGRLAVYSASYFDFGELLLQRLFQAIAKAALDDHDSLRKLKPQDLCNMAWTFAVLGMCHTRFMETALFELKRRATQFIQGDTSGMNSFKGQELANLLWALATLNIPIEDLFNVLPSYIVALCCDRNGGITQSSIARLFKRQELANIAWSCAVFGVYPKELMSLLYAGLVGVGKDQNSDKLSKLHGDSGLQAQAIMSLIYVQTAMDLERKSGGLTLPLDFPDGWRQKLSSQYDDLGDSMIELTLSTSKIQRTVASAFTRIGFEHVEEHVITMHELSQQGINLASKPLEILSIDIAQPSDRVAIEVDGPAHFVTNIDALHDTGGYSKLINGKLEYQFRWAGDQQRINGSTSLKQRLLSLLGWNVISLPFWEWYALGGDASAEEDFCRRLLSQHS